MQRHTELSTEWITTGVTAELTAAVRADVVLADQAAPGALAYHTAALKLRGEQPDPATVDRLHALVVTQHPRYDLLFATVLDPGAPVAGHGYGPAFRDLVHSEVHAYLARHELSHLRVTNDDASRDQAVRAALDAAHTALESAA